jgi:hypothetical protein
MDSPEKVKINEELSNVSEFSCKNCLKYLSFFVMIRASPCRQKTVKIKSPGILAMI